ncbi:MAG: hypothetical protein JSS70_12790 [Bacteroidetes bacterium]|nr:hypothetical protein [Bacteroidota bacterium]
MKPILFFVAVFTGLGAGAQKIDSICFHLYTDSLKKGVHNYINVDGKLSDGRWLPLTAREIDFSGNGGKFEGNDLVLPGDFKPENVTVKAILKKDPSIAKEIIIWIKKKPDDEVLPTKEEILNNRPKQRRKQGGLPY